MGNSYQEVLYLVGSSMRSFLLQQFDLKTDKKMGITPLIYVSGGVMNAFPRLS